MQLIKSENGKLWPMGQIWPAAHSCIDSELSSALCDGLEEWDEGEGGREVLEGGDLCTGINQGS